MTESLATAAEPRTYVAVDVPLTHLRPGAFQPRKRFDEAALQELVDSIRSHGVQQPIVARPIASATPGQPIYEIVAGERRWRACNRLSDELTERGAPLQPDGRPHSIPTFIRELDDFAAAELALMENSNRRDLHPIEEAEAYEKLLLRPSGGGEFSPPRLRGYSVEQLAEKIGHKPNFVYGRLKLLDLVPEAREALLEGTLQLKLAEALARYATTEQSRALPDLLRGWAGEPYTHRQGLQYLRQHFGLKLAAAPFQITDPDLLAEAGSCTTCPKRSGANPDLFGDSDDTCLDGACHQAKVEAHAQALLAKAAADGLTVITGKAVEKLFGKGVTTLSEHTLHAADHLNIDKPAEHLTGSKKKLRAMLGDDFPHAKVVKASGDDLPVTVAAVDQVKTALKAKGLLAGPSSPKAARPGQPAGQKAARPTAEAVQASRRGRVQELLNARLPMAFAKHLEGDGSQGLPDESDAWIDAIAKAIDDQASCDYDALRAAMGQAATAGGDWITQLDREAKCRFILVSLLCTRVNDEAWGANPDVQGHDRLARELGFDLAGLRDELGQEVDTEIRQEIEALAQPEQTPEKALAAAVKKARTKGSKAEKAPAASEA